MVWPGSGPKISPDDGASRRTRRPASSMRYRCLLEDACPSGRTLDEPLLLYEEHRKLALRRRIRSAWPDRFLTRIIRYGDFAVYSPEPGPERYGSCVYPNPRTISRYSRFNANGPMKHYPSARRLRKSERPSTHDDAMPQANHSAGPDGKAIYAIYSRWVHRLSREEVRTRVFRNVYSIPTM